MTSMVRATGRTVSIPAVENNPEYADLIDPKRPGVTKGYPCLP
ncbi:hypothetical protein [Streptomyces sp. NPDC001070]